VYVRSSFKESRVQNDHGSIVRVRKRNTKRHAGSKNKTELNVQLGVAVVTIKVRPDREILYMAYFGECEEQDIAKNSF
jgi:hypothetical protein